MNILQDGVPKDDTIISVMVAREVHHVPVLQVCRVVKVVPVHVLVHLCHDDEDEDGGSAGDVLLKFYVLVDLREKLFESIRPMANGQTDISTASRSGEDLSSKCVNRDDEPEVVMQKV